MAKRLLNKRYSLIRILNGQPARCLKQSFSKGFSLSDQNFSISIQRLNKQMLDQNAFPFRRWCSYACTNPFSCYKYLVFNVMKIGNTMRLLRIETKRVRWKTPLLHQGNWWTGVEVVTNYWTIGIGQGSCSKQRKSFKFTTDFPGSAHSKVRLCTS